MKAPPFLLELQLILSEAAPFFAFLQGHDHGENKPGNWWLPSIKQYAGHEERLPIDGHGVLALIAPRAAAIADGWQDHEGDLTFADEANVVASSVVYKLLGAPDKLRLIHRPGDHHGFDGE